jgi:hypothetical protein
MVKKLFTWGYSGVLVPVFYGAGAGFWALALNADPSRRNFYAAAAFFLCGLIWSLGWLWTHDSLRRSRPRDSNSEKYLKMRKPAGLAGPEGPDEPGKQRRRRTPRRRNKKQRWTAAACSALVVLGVDGKILTTYKARTTRREQGEMQVFVADTQRTAAMKVPVLERPEDTKDMMFALMGVPDKEVFIQKGDKSMKVDVLLRSTYAMSIRNVHVQIDSNVPIKAAAPELTSTGETELIGELPDIPAGGKTVQVYSLPVEVSVPAYQNKAGLLVTVVGDNIKPYAAAARIVFVSKPAVGQLPVSANPEAPAR